MSLYDVLLKNNLIEFDKVLIDRYNMLDLDETDVVLLIKVYNVIKKDLALDASEIAKGMKIGANEVSNRIVDLAKKGYISIDIGDDGKEVVTLDGIILRLHELLMAEDEQTSSVKKNNDVKEVASYAEKAFGKILSPIELQLINHLVNEDGYSAQDIMDAIDECSIKHKFQMKYVDALLQSKKNNNIETIDFDLQEKFNNVLKKK